MPIALIGTLISALTVIIFSCLIVFYYRSRRAHGEFNQPQSELTHNKSDVNQLNSQNDIKVSEVSQLSNAITNKKVLKKYSYDIKTLNFDDSTIVNDNEFSSSHVKASQYMINTIEENPTNVERISDVLMLRSGMVVQESSGVYCWLPLGLRVLEKIEVIAKQKMEAAGSLAMLLPLFYADDPKSDSFSKSLDKSQATLHKIIKSFYKKQHDLPIKVHEIKTSYVKRIRPRFSIINANEYRSLEAYSFHANEECLNNSVTKMRYVYDSLFNACGLNYQVKSIDDSTQRIEEIHTISDRPIKLGKLSTDGLNNIKLNNNTTMLSSYFHVNLYSLLGAIVEQNCDENGFIWPANIAPFQVGIIAINAKKTERVAERANNLYQILVNAGIEVIFDDRDVRPGRMFKDMDLIGIPHRLVVSEATLTKKAIEYKHRKSNTVEYLSYNDILSQLETRMKNPC